MQNTGSSPSKPTISFSPEEQKLLEQLGDLQSAPQDWLLPAIGWWLLIPITLIALWLIWRAYKKLQQRRSVTVYQSQALKLLGDLSLQKQHSAAVNKLLKQVAMQTYGRASCASLSGSAWLEFLAAQQPKLIQPQRLDLLFAHQSQAQSCDLPPDVLSYCKSWIKACPAPQTGAANPGVKHV